jgi:hypothetical protein
MTLQLLQLLWIPYIWGNFYFLFYQCSSTTPSKNGMFFVAVQLSALKILSPKRNSVSVPGKNQCIKLRNTYNDKILLWGCLATWCWWWTGKTVKRKGQRRAGMHARCAAHSTENFPILQKRREPALLTTINIGPLKKEEMLKLVSHEN